MGSYAAAIQMNVMMQTGSLGGVMGMEGFGNPNPSN